MKRPLIGYIGSCDFANHSDFEWVGANNLEELFLKLDDRLPCAILCRNGDDECAKLPSFATTRFIDNCYDISLLNGILELRDSKKPIVVFVSNQRFVHKSTHVSVITLEQFLLTSHCMEECYLFFDSKLSTNLATKLQQSTWPVLSQFKGFVNHFMHWVDDGMTAKSELAMFAFANGFSPLAYDLKVQPFAALMRNEQVPTPIEPEQKTPYGRLLDDFQKQREIVLKTSRELQNLQKVVVALGCTLVIFFFLFVFQKMPLFLKKKT